MISFEVSAEEVRAAGTAVTRVARLLEDLGGALRPGVAALGDATGDARCSASLEAFSSTLGRAFDRLVATFEEVGAVLATDARAYERTDQAVMPGPAGDRPR